MIAMTMISGGRQVYADTLTAEEFAAAIQGGASVQESTNAFPDEQSQAVSSPITAEEAVSSEQQPPALDAAAGSDGEAEEIVYPAQVPLRLRSLDKEILAQWTEPEDFELAAVRVEVDGNGKHVEQILAPGTLLYHFRAGTAGYRYLVTITGIAADQTIVFHEEAYALYLDRTKLPELPLLTIETTDGSVPTCETLTPPPGQPGLAITGNDYVKGMLSVSGIAGVSGPMEMKIKVRGNTSAAGADKKPYKIKLTEKADLLGRGDAFADKEWVLLNTGYNLKTFLGDAVAAEVGMEWVPRMRFVNVEINGDWQGLYVLTETVKKSKSRVAIDDSGYLFENDAYWWKEDFSFRTPGQASFMGYTYKYPEIEYTSDRRNTWLKNEIQTIERLIAAKDERAFDHIDADSYASWILARDLLGQTDAAGSNLYYYRMDNAAGTKIKMGPLWDFDTAFEMNSTWSLQHDVSYLEFDELFEMPAFRTAYAARWTAVAPGLEERLSARMDELLRTQGKAINESRTLDRARWLIGSKPLEDEIREDKAWFQRQLAWMSAQIPLMASGDSEIADDSAEGH